jgi:hypothetical protein
MAATLLLVGDIHLGRRPGGLPGELAGWGLAPSGLTPSAAWRATVDLALRRRVDAVVLAGDVVEADNARFEAFGPLEQGVRRLVEGGIGVWAVAGNHDVEALPRLADLIPGFRLLGRNGSWEQATVSRDGATLLHLLGWSFPTRLHRSSPLESGPLPTPPDDGLPLIGVMHCDLDGSGSPYAPVKRSDLERLPVDGWFLGHVHKPSELDETRPLGYLGSLVGLDPTETGSHGPWLLNVAPGALSLEHVPLAPLRWEEVGLDLSGLAGPEELQAAMIGGLKALHERLGPVVGEARAVGCRVRLAGSTKFSTEPRTQLDQEGAEKFAFKQDDVLYFVEKVVDDTVPALDLERIAAGEDPPALLARRLLKLRGGGETDLLREAGRALDRSASAPWWQRLGGAALDDDRVRELLFAAGMRALAELLAQAPASGPGEGGA